MPTPQRTRLLPVVPDWTSITLLSVPVGCRMPEAEKRDLTASIGLRRYP